MDLLDEDSKRRFDKAISTEVLRAAAVPSSTTSNPGSSIVEITVVDKYRKRSLLLIGRIKRIANVYFSIQQFGQLLDNDRKQPVLTGQDSPANDLQVIGAQRISFLNF